MFTSTLVAFTLFGFLASAQTAEELKIHFSTPESKPGYLKNIYNVRGFEPIFAKDGRWLVTATDLESVEKMIKSHGLNPADYQLQTVIDYVKQNGGTDIQSEIYVAENVLRSIVHVVTGRVDPRKVNDDVKYTAKGFSQWHVFATVNASNLSHLYDQLAPRNKFYAGLRNTLARLTQIEESNAWVKVEMPKTTIHLGQSHPAIAQIKTKLNLLGYGFTNMTEVYDAEFDEALKAIQVDLSVPFEKGLGKKSKTWRLINSEIRTRVRETELQMEKVRWLPDELESRHAIANLANQMFYVQDLELNQNDYIMQFKAIGGQTARKTPLMKDKIRSVILNPTWTATMNIFFNDKLPILKKNPNYLTENNYKVISLKTDEEIDPAFIDWNNVTRANIDFQIVQQPSYNNALGVVKFPMTNKYSIYLHDTGDRHLFKNNYRLISSGCIRLEKPLDFAEYLLTGTSWTRDRIEAIVAKPGERIEKDTGIRLSKALTVYLLSITVSQTGNKIQFFDDYYGLNEALYKKLQTQGFLKN